MSTILVNSGTNKKKKKRLKPKHNSDIQHDDNNSNALLHNVIPEDTELICATKAEKLLKVASKSKSKTQHTHNNTIQQHNAISSNNSNHDGSNIKRHKTKVNGNDQSTSNNSTKTNNLKHGKVMSLSIDGLSQLHSTDISYNELSHRIFEWLIYPLTAERFYKTYYQHKPFVIHRYKQFQPKKCKLLTIKHSYVDNYEWYQNQLNNHESIAQDNKVVQYYVLNNNGQVDDTRSEHYYDGIYSTHDIDDILSQRNTSVNNEPLQWSDFNIVKYNNYVRSDVKPTGKIIAKNIWSLVNEDKCGLRFLCPHKYSTILHRIINLLDNEFGMFTGSNMYYTPANSQSFAPHYDDVDVFIIQCEGSKRWRLYAPMNQSQILDYKSSDNFTQNDIGECILDVVLEEGDFLYAPRGTIHQCNAMHNQHSLHITLSTALNTNYAEYLTRLLPLAIKQATLTNIELRKTLPINYHKYVGSLYTGLNNNVQQEIMNKSIELIQSIITNQHNLPIDIAADHMALQFMNYRVPPCIDINNTYSYNNMLQHKKIKPDVEISQQNIIELHTRLRLTQPNIARLVVDDNNTDNLIQLYHILNNNIEHNNEQLECLEFSNNLTSALELILLSNPLYISVKSLPLPIEYDDNNQPIETDDNEDNQYRIQLVCTLFENGLIEIHKNTSIVDSTDILIKQSM